MTEVISDTRTSDQRILGALSRTRLHAMAPQTNRFQTTLNISELFLSFGTCLSYSLCDNLNRAKILVRVNDVDFVTGDLSVK